MLYQLSYPSPRSKSQTRNDGSGINIDIARTPTAKRLSTEPQLELHFGVMAEWLRRQTRNLVGSAHVGSNPADVV